MTNPAMTKPASPTIGKDGKDYPLTPKQLAFIAHYRELGNASEAYRRSYDTKAKPDVVKVKASQMLDNPKIQAHLRELEKRTKVNVAVTAEWLIERNVRRADEADAKGQHAVAVAAEQLVAKLSGLLVDKVDQTVRQVEPADHKPDLSNLRRGAVSGATDGAQDGTIIH